MLINSKRGFLHILSIFIILTIIKISFGCSYSDDTNTWTGDCSDIVNTAITDKSDISGTFDQSITLSNGMVIPANTPVSIVGGKITAEIQVESGTQVKVTNGEIDGSKIKADSVELLQGNIQDVEGLIITREETTIEKTTYATITPTTASGTTTLVNANNIRLTRTELYVAHADTITVGDTTFTNVNDFRTDFVVFEVDSADVVIAETMVFNKIKNSSFSLSNNQLISAKIQSQINNNTFKFPNLIPLSSKFIEVKADKDESFFINYRKTTTKGECVYFGQNSDENYLELLSLGRRVVFNGSRFSIVSDPLFKIERVVDDRNYSLLIASEKAVQKTASDYEIVNVCELKSTANKRTTDLTLDKEMSVLLENMSFDSTENEAFFSVTENNPPAYRAVKGTFNYTSAYTIEQLESTCGIGEVFVDINKGFVKITLSPEFTILCAGSRYNLIDKIIKEKSYSIYNIGLNNYYLGFEKGMSLMNFKASIYSDNYGFIAEEILLNQIIQYDRIPNSYQFPALSDEEYDKLPIEFKKTMASTHPSNKITIEDDERINLFLENRNMTIPPGTLLLEANSGFFNIKEIQEETITRYANFNKDMLYPDYIKKYETFYGYTTPLITIENKTLTQTGISDEGNPKVVKMYTPDTEESESFLNWLKGRVIIQDINDFLKNILNR